MEVVDLEIHIIDDPARELVQGTDLPPPRIRVLKHAGHSHQLVRRP